MKNTDNIYEIFRQHKELKSETDYLSDLTFEVFENEFLEFLNQETLKAAYKGESLYAVLECDFTYEEEVYCHTLKRKINIFEMITYIRNIPGILAIGISNKQFANGDIKKIIKFRGNTLQIADYIYGEMQRKKYEEQTPVSR